MMTLILMLSLLSASVLVCVIKLRSKEEADIKTQSSNQDLH